MRVGVVEYTAQYFLAAAPCLRRCSKCGGKDVILRPLMGEDEYLPLPPRWEGGLVVSPRSSWSGAHYARIREGREALSLPAPGWGRVFFGKFRVVPEELAEFLHEWPVVAEFRRDQPAGHDAAVVGQLYLMREVELTERDGLCPACWRREMEGSPTHKQGRLFLRHLGKEERPRIYSPHQEGVEEDTKIFNHSFTHTDESPARVLRRGNYGAVYVENGRAAPVRVTSPEHDGDILLDRQGWWEFYHPWPGRGGALD